MVRSYPRYLTQIGTHAHGRQVTSILSQKKCYHLSVVRNFWTVFLIVKFDGQDEKKNTRDTVHNLLNPFCIKFVTIYLSACNFAIMYLYEEIKFKPKE